MAREAGGGRSRRGGDPRRSESREARSRRASAWEGGGGRPGRRRAPQRPGCLSGAREPERDRGSRAPAAQPAPPAGTRAAFTSSGCARRARPERATAPGKRRAAARRAPSRDALGADSRGPGCGGTLLQQVGAAAGAGQPRLPAQRFGGATPGGCGLLAPASSGPPSPARVPGWRRGRAWGGGWRSLFGKGTRTES